MKNSYTAVLLYFYRKLFLKNLLISASDAYIKIPE